MGAFLVSFLFGFVTYLDRFAFLHEFEGGVEVVKVEGIGMVEVVICAVDVVRDGVIEPVERDENTAVITESLNDLLTYCRLAGSRCTGDANDERFYCRRRRQRCKVGIFQVPTRLRFNSR